MASSDDPGDGKVAERLVVAGNGEPGRVLGRGALQRLVEGGEVVVEVGALLVVGIADLPLPVRVVEPLGEAPELLRLGDDQAELEDRGAVLLVEQPLPVVDQLVAALPDLARHQLVHAGDQHVLVMRAVEHRDLALGRRVRVDAPEEVVRGLFGRGDLEPLHLAALRVHGADHVPAHAVLAGGVQPLQHDQERVAVVAVHLALQVAQLGLDGLELLGRRLVVAVLAAEGGIELLEPDLAAGLDHQLLGVVHVACPPAIGWWRTASLASRPSWMRT